MLALHLVVRIRRHALTLHNVDRCFAQVGLGDGLAFRLHAYA